MTANFPQGMNFILGDISPDSLELSESYSASLPHSDSLPIILIFLFLTTFVLTPIMSLSPPFPLLLNFL